MHLGNGIHIKTSEFPRHKSIAVCFLLQMSSLARSKVVRDTMTDNNIFHKSMDEDIAEVLQAKDKPSSRTRAYSSCIHCFSVLKRVEGIQQNHCACRRPPEMTSYQGLSTRFCYQQWQQPDECRSEKMWGFQHCQHGCFKHGPID